MEDPHSLELNFTVNWRHRHQLPLLFPFRWKHVMFTIGDGPYESNEIITKDHIWSEQGDYFIRARAKDAHGAIGEWGTLKVTMPKNKAFNINLLFLRFLEKHPNMFQMLRHLLG